MTGPEQHAATVREALRTVIVGHEGNWRRVVDPAGSAALDELVALAERADELERENERLRRDPKTHPFSTGMDFLARAEAAERERDDWHGLFISAMEKLVAAEARADELQRERDEALDIIRGGNCIRNESGESPCEQARGEAEQVRAALRNLLEYRDGKRSTPDWDAARAALAGVQADNKDSA